MPVMDGSHATSGSGSTWGASLGFLGHISVAPLSPMVIIKQLIKKEENDILTKTEQSAIAWEPLFTFPGDTLHTLSKY